MGSIEQTIGQRIAQARRAAQLNQTQLAERVDVTLETISRLERGVSMPSLARIEAIARALGVSLAWLVREDPSDERAAVLEEVVELLRPCDAATLHLARAVVATIVRERPAS